MTGNFLTRRVPNALRMPHAIAVMTPLLPVIVGGTFLFVLTAYFARWNASSALAFPQFVLATLVLFYFPGRFLAELSRDEASSIERTLVGMVLSLVLSIVCFMFAAEIGNPRLFLAYPIVGTAGFLVIRWRGPNAASGGFKLRWEHALLAGLLGTVFFALSVQCAYFHNGIRSGIGRSELNAVLYHDLRLHLAISQELTHAWPPQIPFLSGELLRYHVGMDTLANMYLLIGPFELLDLVNRFLPTLVFTLLALAAFSLGKAYLNSGPLGVCFAALVIFGEDFYALVMLVNPSLSPLYHMPSLNSLFFHNPNLHGLVILLAGLYSLTRYMAKPSGSTLVQASVLLAGVALFKVFYLAQLLGALAGTSLLYWLLYRDQRLFKVLAGTCIALIPILFLMRHGLGNDRHEISLSMLPGLALHPLWFLTITLGMRLFAAPALIRAVRTRSGPDQPGLFLVVFIVLGSVMGLTVRIETIGQTWNNGYWTYLSGKFVLWLFVLQSIQQLFAASPVFRRSLLLLTMAVAMLPSVLFLQKHSYKTSLPSIYAPADLALFQWLRTAVPAGSNVMMESDSLLPLSCMTPCRTIADPVLDLFAPSFITAKNLEERRQDRTEFWQSWDNGELSVSAIVRRRIDFVIVQPAKHRAKLPNEIGLSPVFQNETYRVYDVRGVRETLGVQAAP